MADNDLDSASKVGLKEIEGIKKSLNLKFSSRIDAAEPINEFTKAINTHYSNFLSLHHTQLDLKDNLNLKNNMQELYQNVSLDFKLLADKLAFNQNDKKQVLNDVVKQIDLAFLVSSQHLQGLDKVSEIIPQNQAQKIIAEYANENHRDVVTSLVTENLDQLQKKTQYLKKINDLREGDTENKFDKIAKLNAQLQKDLNLNDRQINELNIGVGHYINSNRGAFKADFEKLQGKDKDNISREDITKVLNKKTAESAQKPIKTRVQAAKSVVIGASKSATKTVTSQWQNPSKSEATLTDTKVKISQKREKTAQWNKVAQSSDKNPKIAASNYRKSQEVDSKSSHINNLHNVSNLDKTQVKQDNKTILSRVLKTVPTTKLERVYDAAVRGIEADVKQKANAKFTEIKSTVSHKMPPEAKAYAAKIGHDALEKVHSASARVESAKKTVKTFVKDTWKGR